MPVKKQPLKGKGLNLSDLSRLVRGEARVVPTPVEDPAVARARAREARARANAEAEAHARALIEAEEQRKRELIQEDREMLAGVEDDLIKLRKKKLSETNKEKLESINHAILYCLQRKQVLEKSLKKLGYTGRGRGRRKKMVGGAPADEPDVYRHTEETIRAQAQQLLDSILNNNGRISSRQAYRYNLDFDDIRNALKQVKFTELSEPTKKLLRKLNQEIPRSPRHDAGLGDINVGAGAPIEPVVPQDNNPLAEIETLLNTDVNTQEQAREVDAGIRRQQEIMRGLLSTRDYNIHRSRLNQDPRYIRISEMCHYTFDEYDDLEGGSLYRERFVGGRKKYDPTRPPDKPTQVVPEGILFDDDDDGEIVEDPEWTPEMEATMTNILNVLNSLIRSTEQFTNRGERIPITEVREINRIAQQLYDDNEIVIEHDDNEESGAYEDLQNRLDEILRIHGEREDGEYEEDELEGGSIIGDAKDLYKELKERDSPYITQEFHRRFEELKRRMNEEYETDPDYLQHPNSYLYFVRMIRGDLINEFRRAKSFKGGSLIQPINHKSDHEYCCGGNLVQPVNAKFLPFF